MEWFDSLPLNDDPSVAAACAVALAAELRSMNTIVEELLAQNRSYGREIGKVRELLRQHVMDFPALGCTDEACDCSHRRAKNYLIETGAI